MATANDSLIARLLEALRRHEARTLVVTPGRDGADDRGVTGRELIDLAARCADGLRALGVASGEPVLLWSENRERWMVADLALLALGCPDAPRGVEAPAEEIAYIVDKLRARFAFVEKPELLPRLSRCGPSLTTVILLSGEKPAAASGPRTVIRFDELLARADAAQAVARFEASVAQRRADEVATVVFTSGTTGRPKGVVLSQRNLASNLAQVLTVIGYLAPGGSILSVLPPWHMFERMVEYALLSLGLRIVYSDRRRFAKDLGRLHPEVLAAVPRLWLLMMEGVRAKIAAAPKRRRRLAELALAVATKRARRRRFGVGSALGAALLAPVELLLRRVVLRKIAAALGVDRLHHGLAISGGGTLPDHVDLFFAALGVELLNGYGLTETSPVLTLRLPQRNVGGTVGLPLAGTEIAVRDVESGVPLPAGRRGVLHARGPQVMTGYFDDPEATAAVLASDGWFNTGDLGHVTAAGDVAITGRAKETIVLMSGENVEPEPLENALTSSPFIEQAVVVGQDRKFLAALIVPRTRDGDAPRPDAELKAVLRREIDERVSPRAGFRAHERIARFHVLPRPFSLEEGFLSQTLKIKRGVVHERLAAEIDALFRDAGSDDEG